MVRSTSYADAIGSRAWRAWPKASRRAARRGPRPHIEPRCGPSWKRRRSRSRYGFSVGSLARLNAHLAREMKISFSEDQLGRILHAEGFSVQRPKHTLQGKRDEAAYEKARRQLKRLKKGRWPKIALLS